MAAQKRAQRKSVKGEAKSSKKSSSSRTRAKNAPQPKKRRWLRVVVTVLIAAVVIVVAAFSWDRWFRFDDAADIQGSWQASGQAALVEIDDELMHLTDEVAYRYVLDTGAKTIEFSFGKLTGSGTYRFSDDRQTLTIVEGGSSNIFREFFLLFGLDIAAGDDADKPTTVFSKKAGVADAEPSSPADDQSDGRTPGDGPSSEGSASDGSESDGSADDAGGEAQPAPSDEANGDAGEGEGGSDGGADPRDGDGMLFDTINDRGAS